MPTKSHPAWFYVLFPAVAMLLGWGLRGYIGGGPYGALIPGAFVALCLCLLLGYKRETAAVAAAFGAIGVGYGGDMTYGQTLGFLREGPVWWGLLGCLLKGGVWGLFGGAVIGAGFDRRRYPRATLVAAFLLSIVAFYVGWKLINEPRLLYFSNREDRPRDESWAGLLLAALTFLSVLRFRGSAEDCAIPMRFARWGLLGGAIGFGGGALWMVIGPNIPIEQKWIGWWKMMEFSFGFCFGAALGWCAYLNRHNLVEAGQRGDAPEADWRPFFGVVAVLAAIFLSEIWVPRGLEPGIGRTIFYNGLRMVFAFVFFGGIAASLSLYSRHAAWQVAITLTFFHTVFDFVRDLDTVERFGYALSTNGQLFYLFGATGIAGVVVAMLQDGRDAVRRLLLLVVWLCYGTACFRSFGLKDFVYPPEGETMGSLILAHHPSLIFVHGTFTVSALLTTWWALTRFRAPEEPQTSR